ncbi:putative lipoprotein lppW [Mycobacterium xenopi 4042]|uniref:Putative lipoprotein lppW n=1 Tax=Mycobacterium xenopi 4042 TaxID=1299334 RepID=X8E810_MYCXE|nr:putative lipoprotein lppW [Mycobacterium xenopi 4042]
MGHHHFDPDLIRYYQMLLDGSGGLPPERAKIIIDDLASSTPPASMATRSGSAYPTGSTPNRSR